MKFIIDAVKGIFIGIANIIPGVSGGTMAVSMGIYDDIIYSITHLKSEFKKSVKILFPYLIGMVVGIVGLSYLIGFLLENYTMQTNFAFIGLILGGLPILLKRFKGKKVGVGCGVSFLIFFALIIGLQLLNGTNSGDVVINLGVVEIIKLFFIGVIASATMVIPGVSGSMILMILGYYNPVLDCVQGFVTEAMHLQIAAAWDYAAILIPFGIGVIIGIFAIAKLIEVLLKNLETITFSAILGLVVASPFAILMSAGLPTLTFMNVSVSIVTFACGFVVALFLGRE